MQGITSDVSRVEVISPPMTTVASGRCISAPSLVDNAIGKKPRLATKAVIRTGRNRIKAVHFGHVHGSFQIVRDGILYVAAPSAFAQLENWPNAEEALLDAQPPGFNIVTIDGEQFLVRNRIVR